MEWDGEGGGLRDELGQSESLVHVHQLEQKESRGTRDQQKLPELGAVERGYGEASRRLSGRKQGSVRGSPGESWLETE
jgi:hypothetical protein